MRAAGGLGRALLLEVVGRRQWAVGRTGRATCALPLLGTAAPRHARCSCWGLPCAHCHTHPMCCKRTHLQAGPRAAAVLAQAQQAQRARRHASGAAGRAEEVALVLGKGIVAGAGREEGGVHEAREPLPRPGPGRLRRAGRALGCPASRHLGGAPLCCCMVAARDQVVGWQRGAGGRGRRLHTTHARWVGAKGGLTPLFRSDRRQGAPKQTSRAPHPAAPTACLLRASTQTPPPPPVLTCSRVLPPLGWRSRSRWQWS